MGEHDQESLDEYTEVRGVSYGDYGQVGQQYVVMSPGSMW